MRLSHAPGLSTTCLAGLVAVALLSTGCASRFHARVHYVDDFDFSKVKVLSFEPEDDPRLENLPKEMKQDRLVARGAIREGILAIGDELGPPDEADLWIRFSLSVKAKARTSGSSSWGSYALLRIQGLVPGTRRIVWTGEATETWNESMDPTAEIRKAVAVLFEQLPPGQEKPGVRDGEKGY